MGAYGKHSSINSRNNLVYRLLYRPGMASARSLQFGFSGVASHTLKQNGTHEAQEAQDSIPVLLVPRVFLIFSLGKNN